MKISKLAQSITTSPILTIAAQINEKIAAGEKLYNFTVGDFNPDIFPIPKQLQQETIAAYRANETNYPGAFGVLALRQSVADTLNRICGLDYQADEVQIASGSRPLIYACFKALVDPGDKVVFPVPSWNNESYSLLSNANAVTVDTKAENDFMPTAEELRPHLHDAQLLALCSPQNPSGTVFTQQGLKDICDLIIEENARRSAEQKPLYIMFDQVYWLLTFGETKFHHPLTICPEIKDYAVFIDGLSKSLAGTGIRVGWATAPTHVLPKIRAFIAHIGAWAPKPEQVASAKFLENTDALDQYLDNFRAGLEARLQSLYFGFKALKDKGYPVDAIAPQAGIYLSVKIDLKGKQDSNGNLLADDTAVHQYLFESAKLGILPFSWFGASLHGDWFRISVGTCRLEEIKQVLDTLEHALAELT